MALFKVLRGNRENLPETKHDGWAYFCTDTGEFFIDYDTGLKDNNAPILKRKRVSGGAQLIEWANGDEEIEDAEGEENSSVKEGDS